MLPGWRGSRGDQIGLAYRKDKAGGGKWKRQLEAGPFDFPYSGTGLSRYLRIGMYENRAGEREAFASQMGERLKNLA